jgi:twitching motility protein PilU
MEQNVTSESALVGPDAGLLDLLTSMVHWGASDLFLTVAACATIKVEGRMVPLSEQPLARGAVWDLARSVMTPDQIAQFERDLECDLALTLDGLGRFRFNVYVQRGEVSMVVRHVRSQVPSFKDLGLPNVLESLALARQGLVLVVGAAGTGKSTTLAAMLELRNQRLPGHILTVEDPIEYLHTHARCIVDQREVGLDTRSFSNALRHALREAPDVIMVGEIRDDETMRHALHFAETGHLCVSTLHANNANQAIDRVVNFFPPNARQQVLLDLSLNLRGIVAQRLVQGVHGRRVLASEVMLHSPYIAELIQKGQIDDLKAAIGRSNESGMHSFDQSLYELFHRGDISLEQALEHADSRTDLSLRVRLARGLPPDEDQDDIKTVDPGEKIDIAPARRRRTGTV